MATFFAGISVPQSVAFPAPLATNVDPAQTLSIPDFGYVFEGLPLLETVLDPEPENLDWTFEGEPHPGMFVSVDGIAGVGTFLGALASFVRTAAPWVFVSDEGGQVVDFRPPAEIGTGPFLVRLVDNANDIWPDDRLGCWSGEPGRGFEIWTLRDRRRFRFVLPPLPLGEYTLRVLNPAGDTVLEVPQLFRVVRRQRPWPIGYGFSRAFPQTWPLGDRHPQLEAFATDENRPPYNGWRAVGRALGWILQRYGAPACTRLREDYTPGDVLLQVETTLGFDTPLEIRSVWIDGLRVPIFAVDPDARTFALTTDDTTENARSNPPIRSLAGGLPVVVDEGGCPHPDIFVEPDLGAVAVEPSPLFAYRDSNVSTPILVTLGDAMTFGAVSFWHRQGAIGVNGHAVLTTFVPPLIGGPPGPFSIRHVPSGTGTGYRIQLVFGAATATSTDIFEPFAGRGTGTWRSYIVTYGGGFVRLYVDGLEICQLPGAGPFVASLSMLGGTDINTLGALFVPAKRIANIAVWTSPISAGGAALLHAAGLKANPVSLPTPAPSGPLGLWRVDIVDDGIINTGTLAPANNMVVGPGVTTESLT